MSESLKQKTVKGLAWNALDNFAGLGIQFLIGVILAPLLFPSEYGIIGLGTVVLAVSEAFITAGFGSALIRKQDRTETDNSTVFFFSVVASIVFYFLLYVTAPLISDFYHQEILTSITRVLGLTLIAGAFCIVPNALFSSRIDFKTTAKISVITGIAGGVTGIILAYFGYGVWALVYQMLVNQFVRSILLFVYSKWWPQERFSEESFKTLFSFGSKLMFSGLLNAIYGNLYAIVIGKLFAPSTLGLYTRASAFARLPSSNLTNVLQRVTYPVLSTIQDETERLADIYRRLLKMSAYVIFPMMMLLFGVSDPMVRWILTDKWEGCIILLQIICFSLMWYPIHAINLNLLQVKGRSDLFLKLEIIKKIVGTVIVLVFSHWGIIALCLGGIISSFISLIINTYYTGKLINVGFVRQMLDVFPIFVISLIGGGLALLITCIPIEWNLVRLIAGCLVFVVFYLVASNLWLKSEYEEVLTLLKIKKKR